MTYISLIVFLSLVLCGCESAPPLQVGTPKDELMTSLERVVPGLMKKEKIQGTAIAVIRDGKVAFTQTFGFSNQEQRLLVNENTVFEVASLGKPVFAYLVLKLVDQGLLDLDRPLVSYVPDLFSKKDQRLHQITARMILSHSSGLANYGTDDPEALEGIPGKQFKYSGIGYSYLQKVIEKQAGEPLEVLAQKYVFQPLQMASSTFIWNKRFSQNIALGYDKNGRKVSQRRPSTKGHAAWSLYSTLGDYAKFVAFNISVLSEKKSSTSSMEKIQIKITQEISWGLGWGIQNTKPHPSLWHWGSNPGFRGYVVFYPKEKIGVVVISNNSKFFKIVDDIISIAIGGDLPSYHWF